MEEISLLRLGSGGLPKGLSSDSTGNGRVPKTELLTLALCSIMQLSHSKGLYSSTWCSTNSASDRPEQDNLLP
jgi:hypothetical protein